MKIALPTWGFPCMFTVPRHAWLNYCCRTGSIYTEDELLQSLDRDHRTLRGRTDKDAYLGDPSPLAQPLKEYRATFTGVVNGWPSWMLLLSQSLNVACGSISSPFSAAFILDTDLSGSCSY
ncbi:hypothetical protein SAY87_030030 [Trapa incisa]|uniref:Uncharacterized protein n=1 Tax=Trapa incisa TaxID=236973 RepID=A0AAN7K8M4_9MYRT|nr:hypothetical protein SAY87_030030 [Trapa incisa]